MSDPLQPHDLQHARPPCPLPTAGVHENPCPLSQWCHPTISSSVVPFSSCRQSFQHQSLFKWVSSLHQVAKVLEFQLQHQSYETVYSELTNCRQTSKKLFQDTKTENHWTQSCFLSQSWYWLDIFKPICIWHGVRMLQSSWKKCKEFPPHPVNELMNFPHYDNCKVITWK